MNWVPPQHIRPNVLGVFMRGDEVLVVPITGHKGNVKGYRAPGGGIEFGELAEAALHREIQEELGQPIRILRRLGISENIFEYEGHKGHEISMVYMAEFEDKSMYEREKVFYTEAGREEDYMVWLSPAKTDQPFFPDDFLEMLKAA